MKIPFARIDIREITRWLAFGGAWRASIGFAVSP